MSPILFDPTLVRNDASPADPHEDTVTFLNRIEGPFWDRVRYQIEHWVSHYPASDRDDLVSRMTADSTVFRSAYWELYLYNLVQAHGGTAECHPEVPGTTNRPDFLVSGLSAEPFYLEAQVLGVPPDDAKAMQRDGEIWHGVNKRVTSSTYMARLNIETRGHRQPPVTKLARAVQQWLDTLDEEAVSDFEHYGLSPNPATLFWSDEQSGWELSLTPRVKDGPNPSNELIGVGPTYFGMSTDTIDLRKALGKKYTRYGKDLGRPFVVAFLGDRLGIDDIDVTQVLYGDEMFIANRDLDAPTRMDRKPNGIWRRHDGPRGTRLSAFIIAKNVAPWLMNESDLTLWRNAWAQYPSDVHLDNVNIDEVVDDQVEKRQATKTHAETFSLPHRWPGPEPAFPRS